MASRTMLPTKYPKHQIFINSSTLFLNCVNGGKLAFYSNTCNLYVAERTSPALSCIIPMAAAASNSSSSSSFIASQAKYDVFLNFRGEDTRCIFTCHLYRALRGKNINAFMDDEAIERGDELSPTLLAAIERAKLSIVILSKNYASSRWCLDELIKIMECKETKQQIVVPVFYHIDASHVRKQSGTFENAFAKHGTVNPSKVQTWRTVLCEVANLRGWDTKNIRLESDLVMAITEDILRKLNCVSNPEVPSNLVGIDKHVEIVESLLCIGSKNVRIVGIWGMGGIGKTTIAELLFKKHSAKFEGCCFLDNVREEWKKQGKKELRNKLLSKILGDQEVHVNTPSISSSFTVDRLRRRSILIVLDDVNSTQQIEDLVGEKAWFGLGSRIIVTIRDKDVLKENDGIYKVMQMNNEEALHLFNLKAFEQGQPKCEFIDLSKMIVNYASGNPLALKVLGSLLHSKNLEEWKSTLKKLKRVPNKEIHHVLRMSFEELDYQEQQIFLDIACSLKGETKWHIINLLDDCSYSTNIGLRSLENKSLITISGNYVQMHDLIQEVGWQIVQQESPKEFGKRSRLWDPEEIYHVFKCKKAMDYFVESILLDMSEVKDVEISPGTFNRMQKLRILKFYMPHCDKRCNVHIPQGLESLPDELRCLHWDLFPLKCLPSSFCPEMLVQVNLQGSLIEKLWEGEQDLTNLKSLSLSRCDHLIELPNLSKATNLQEIHLDNCVSLCDIPPSMLSLDSLMALNLSNCRMLQCIRSDKHSKSLRWLNLSGCSRLANFLVNSEKFEFLSLEGTAVENLPLLIGSAKNLHCFHFSKCKKLENLPKDFYQIGLETLDTQIYFNDCPKLKKLPPIVNTSLCITILRLNGCSNLSELPNDLGHLVALHELSVEGSSIVALPPSFKLLSHLQALNVSHCKKLQFLPELPLSIIYLDAHECTSLEAVSSSAATALIQKFFGNPNWRLLLRQFQESKGSLHWGRYNESFGFVNCTQLEENVSETIVAEALARIKYVAYMLPMLKAYAESDSCHECNLLYKDFDGESYEGTCHQSPVLYGVDFPPWSNIREIGSFPYCGIWCSSCVGSYTAFDLLKEQDWTNTHYEHGSQQTCKNHVDVVKFQIWGHGRYWDHKVSVCLPGSRVPSCFKYRTIEPCITLELPPCSDLLGFVFCLVLSPEFQFLRLTSMPYVHFTCTCLDLKVCKRFHYGGFYERVISEHVFLYYDLRFSVAILKALKEHGAYDQCITGNLDLSFEFYSSNDGRKDGINECGVWPLYASDIEMSCQNPEEEKIEENISTFRDITRMNINQPKLKEWQEKI